MSTRVVHPAFPDVVRDVTNPKDWLAAGWLPDATGAATPDEPVSEPDPPARPARPARKRATK